MVGEVADVANGLAASGDVLLDEIREVSSMVGIDDALQTIEYHLSVVDRSCG